VIERSPVRLPVVSVPGRNEGFSLPDLWVNSAFVRSLEFDVCMLALGKCFHLFLVAGNTVLSQMACESEYHQDSCLEQAALCVGWLSHF